MVIGNAFENVSLKSAGHNFSSIKQINNHNYLKILDDHFHPMVKNCCKKNFNVQDDNSSNYMAKVNGMKNIQVT